MDEWSTVCFLESWPKKNAGSFLTPVSEMAFYALSHGTLGFALHGSSFYHFLFGGILQQPIKFFDVSGYQSYYGEQNREYHVKEHKNYIRNWRQK